MADSKNSKSSNAKPGDKASGKPSPAAAKPVQAAKPAQAAKPVQTAKTASPAPTAKVAPTPVTKPAATPAAIAKPVPTPPLAPPPVPAAAKAIDAAVTETAMATAKAVEAIVVPTVNEVAKATARITPTAATQETPTTKGKPAMANTYEATKTVTDRVQGAFGEAGDRAKGVFEKTTKMATELGDLTKGNLEAVVASGKVAMKGAEEIAQYSAEYGKKTVEQANTTLRSFASVKSPTELFQLQSEYAKTSFDSMIAEASKFSENYMKLMGEMVQPLSSRYAIAAEKIKSATAL